MADRPDNTTEACRHCPTPEVHPTRSGSVLTYEPAEPHGFDVAPDPRAPHPDWCTNLRAHHRWDECYAQKWGAAPSWSQRSQEIWRTQESPAHQRKPRMTETPRTRLLAFIEKVTAGMPVDEAIGLEQDQFVSDIESLLWEEQAATERERAEGLDPERVKRALLESGRFVGGEVAIAQLIEAASRPSEELA